MFYLLTLAAHLKNKKLVQGAYFCPRLETQKLFIYTTPFLMTNFCYCCQTDSSANRIELCRSRSVALSRQSGIISSAFSMCYSGGELIIINMLFARGFLTF